MLELGFELHVWEYISAKQTETSKLRNIQTDVPEQIIIQHLSKPCCQLKYMAQSNAKEKRNYRIGEILSINNSTGEEISSSKMQIVSM